MAPLHHLVHLAQPHLGGWGGDTLLAFPLRTYLFSKQKYGVVGREVRVGVLVAAPVLKREPSWLWAKAAVCKHRSACTSLWVIGSARVLRYAEEGRCNKNGK